MLVLDSVRSSGFLGSSNPAITKYTCFMAALAASISLHLQFHVDSFRTGVNLLVSTYSRDCDNHPLSSLSTQFPPCASLTASSVVL